MFQLGGLGSYMNAATELQASRGEPLRDTARVLGRYYDCIVWRTYRQRDLEELAAYAGVPVINGLTDYAHPCQVLADLMTIRERRGPLEGQKLCFVGDGNNMANSLIAGGLLAGMQVTLRLPARLPPPRPTCWPFAQPYGPAFRLLDDPREGVRDADVVVTAVWNNAAGGGGRAPDAGLPGLPADRRPAGGRKARLHGPALPARPPGRGDLQRRL